MSSLDLSFNADLSEKHSEIFSKLAISKIKIFNKLFGRLYYNVDEKNFLLWVISNTSSRNPYSSKIFYYYLSYFFLKKILNEENIKIIIVDSLVQKKILEKIIKKKKIEVKLKKKSSQSKIKFFKFLLRFVVIKFTKIFDINREYPKKISLIMTNLVDGHVKKNRFFPKLFNLVKKKKNIFFVPNITIFRFFPFIKNLIILRRQKNYLIKEDFVSIRDLLSIKKINNNIRSIFSKKDKLEKISLTDLIIEEVLDQKNNFSYLESYINYIFIKNLKKKNFIIKTSIVWFENQPLERSWSYSLGKYHKDTKNIGYMGIVPAKMYISQDHTIPEDREFKIIPKNIFTIGDYFKKNIKKYDSNLLAKSVSALSFQHLFMKEKYQKRNYILVALPVLDEDANNILTICQKIINNNSPINYKFLIRPHPTSNFNKIKQQISNLKLKNFEIDLNKNFYESLKISKFFLGGMSSTCLEAIILNVPTIIYKTNDYLRSSCIPDLIKRDYYLYSNNFKHIIEFINKGNKKFINFPNRLKNKCFNIVSNNLMNEFNL